MNSLFIFGQHPCPVYQGLTYMGDKSISLTRRASLAIKSSLLVFR